MNDESPCRPPPQALHGLLFLLAPERWGGRLWGRAFVVKEIPFRRGGDGLIWRITTGATASRLASRCRGATIQSQIGESQEPDVQ